MVADCISIARIALAEWKKAKLGGHASTKVLEVHFVRGAIVFYVREEEEEEEESTSASHARLKRKLSKLPNPNLFAATAKVRTKRLTVSINLRRLFDAVWTAQQQIA